VRSSTFPRRRVSVPKFRFSHRAEADLFNIGLYTFRTWGDIQTDRYIRQLEDCCQLLGNNPALDRAWALSFEKIENANPAVAKLPRFCIELVSGTRGDFR
jgi:hypothetical protein